MSVINLLNDFEKNASVETIDRTENALTALWAERVYIALELMDTPDSLLLEYVRDDRTGGKGLGVSQTVKAVKALQELADKHDVQIHADLSPHAGNRADGHYISSSRLEKLAVRAGFEVTGQVTIDGQESKQIVYKPR